MITQHYSSPNSHIGYNASAPARKPFSRLIRFLLAVFLFLPSLAACTGAPPATIKPTPLPQDTITPTSTSTPTPTEVVIPTFEPGQFNPQDIPDSNAILDRALVKPESQGGSVDTEALRAQGLSPLAADTAEGQVLSVVNVRNRSVDVPFLDSIFSRESGEALAYAPDISGEGFVGYRGASGKTEYMLTRFPLSDGTMTAAAAVSYNQDDRGTLYVYFFSGGDEIIGRINPVFAEGERPLLVADATGRLHLFDASGRELVYDLASSRWMAIEPSPTPSPSPTPDYLVLGRETAESVYAQASQEWQRVHGDEGGYSLTENEDGSLSLSLTYAHWDETVQTAEGFVRFNLDGTAVIKDARYSDGEFVYQERSVRIEDVSYDPYYRGISLKEDNETVAIYVHELGMWLSTELRGGASADIHATVMLPDFDNRADFIPNLLDVERRWVESNRIDAGEYYCPQGSAFASNLVPYELIAYTSNENGAHSFGGFLRANGHLVYVLGAVHRVGTENYYMNYMFDMKGIQYRSIDQNSPVHGALPYLQRMITLGYRPPSINLWYNIFTGETTNPSLASRYWPSFEYIYSQEPSLTRDLLMWAFIGGDTDSMGDLQSVFIPAINIKQNSH